MCDHHPIWTNTMYDLPSAGASGDPHATNLKNEQFDIHATGTMNMITIPRGSAAGNAEFAVYATTTENGWSMCAPSFITEVKVYQESSCEETTIHPGNSVPEVT